MHSSASLFTDTTAREFEVAALTKRYLLDGSKLMPRPLSMYVVEPVIMSRYTKFAGSDTSMAAPSKSVSRDESHARGGIVGHGMSSSQIPPMYKHDGSSGWFDELSWHTSNATVENKEQSRKQLVTSPEQKNH